MDILENIRNESLYYDKDEKNIINYRRFYELVKHPLINIDNMFKFILPVKNHLFVGISHNSNIKNIEYIFKSNGREFSQQGNLICNIWKMFPMSFPICLLENSNEIIVKVYYETTIDTPVIGEYISLSNDKLHMIANKLLYKFNDNLSLVSGLLIIT